MESTGAERYTRLSVGIWHPDCWTLEVTDRCEAGLLGHGVYEVDGGALGNFTVYADSQGAVERLVELAEASPLTESVRPVEYRGRSEAGLPVSKAATLGLLVTYDHGNSIQDALLERGFVPDQPVRIHDGREYWSLLAAGGRDEIRERIGGAEDATGADIDVIGVSSVDGGNASGVLRDDALSPRQREVFEFAREEGYYEWPRETTAKALAASFGVSKATFLEHLRKAEAKLLDPPA